MKMSKKGIEVKKSDIIKWGENGHIITMIFNQIVFWATVLQDAQTVRLSQRCGIIYNIGFHPNSTKVVSCDHMLKINVFLKLMDFPLPPTPSHSKYLYNYMPLVINLVGFERIAP